MFTAYYGHLNYQVIFFRLTNALVTFWGYINEILAKKLNIFIFINLNNIFIYTKYKKNKHMKAIQ